MNKMPMDVKRNKTLKGGTKVKNASCPERRKKKKKSVTYISQAFVWLFYLFTQQRYFSALNFISSWHSRVGSLFINEQHVMYTSTSHASLVHVKDIIIIINTHHACSRIGQQQSSSTPVCH